MLHPSVALTRNRFNNWGPLRLMYNTTCHTESTMLRTAVLHIYKCIHCIVCIYKSSFVYSSARILVTSCTRPWVPSTSRVALWSLSTSGFISLPGPERVVLKRTRSSASSRKPRSKRRRSICYNYKSSSPNANRNRTTIRSKSK